MKQTHNWCQTPPSVTVKVQPNSICSLQVRRGLRLKREAESPSGGKQQLFQHPDEKYYSRMTIPPTIVIQRQEMASYFRLFDDDLIQDFLWMDCCCKMTDKYLLAMVFVYFKRSRFTITEYTKRNFFIALYLANTMEEDEEESKYEIFPWALGKNWRKHFPRFLKQRDRLWARIEYRAAVSRRCCEEVMAIVPSHFVWKRERSEHHSGAHRQYGDRDQACLPRGPATSPLPCSFCTLSTSLDGGPGFPSPRGSSVLNPSYQHALNSQQSLEKTPHKATAAAYSRKSQKTKHRAKRSSSCFTEEAPRYESSCGSRVDASMDWISEE
ncbi:speedy protein A [Aulostomus maculatus]